MGDTGAEVTLFAKIIVNLLSSAMGIADDFNANNAMIVLFTRD